MAWSVARSLGSSWRIRELSSYTSYFTAAATTDDGEGERYVAVIAQAVRVAIECVFIVR